MKRESPPTIEQVAEVIRRVDLAPLKNRLVGKQLLGLLMYFIYNGVPDIARPRLFDTVEEAGDAWDDPQTDVPYYDSNPETDEVVEVMPYFKLGGDNEVEFKSRADRCRRLITGAPSLDSALAL